VSGRGGVWWGVFRKKPTKHPHLSGDPNEPNFKNLFVNGI
jgi:hypothetical protein